jgi:hypothetical protein
VAFEQPVHVEAVFVFYMPGLGGSAPVVRHDDALDEHVQFGIPAVRV